MNKYKTKALYIYIYIYIYVLVYICTLLEGQKGELQEGNQTGFWVTTENKR